MYAVLQPLHTDQIQPPWLKNTLCCDRELGTVPGALLKAQRFEGSIKWQMEI